MSKFFKIKWIVYHFPHHLALILSPLNKTYFNLLQILVNVQLNSRIISLLLFSSSYLIRKECFLNLFLNFGIFGLTFEWQKQRSDNIYCSYLLGTACLLPIGIYYDLSSLCFYFQFFLLKMRPGACVIKLITPVIYLDSMVKP